MKAFLTDCNAGLQERLDQIDDLTLPREQRLSEFDRGVLTGAIVANETLIKSLDAKG